MAPVDRFGSLVVGVLVSEPIFGDVQMENNQAPTTIVTSTPLDVLIGGWIHAKGNKSGSEKTRKAYADTLAQFRTGLRQLGLDLDSQDDHELAQIALAAQAFSSFSARGKHVKAATINQRLAILSSFYDYAIRQGPPFLVNPIGRVDRSKVQAYASAQPLTKEATTVALDAIDRSTLAGKRDYALIALLLQTGRRLTEIASLEIKHLALTVGKLTITFEHCKGGKEMRDTLPYSVSNALLEWLRAFYGADVVPPGATGDTRPVWVALANTGHKKGYTRIGDTLGPQSVADICQKRLGTSKVHATRHTWAHEMEKAGASASIIQARLGHESLATTGRYLAQLSQAENPYADVLAANLGIK